MKKSELRQIIKEEVSKVLKEIQYDDPFNKIEIGDTFYDTGWYTKDDKPVWTVTDIFVPEWQTEVEGITLETEDGQVINFPEDTDRAKHNIQYARNGGDDVGSGFFDWFSSITKLNENEENTFDTLKNQAKTVKGFKDLNGEFKGRDGFSLTFRNGQRTIEFSPSSLKDNVSYTYDYEGNTGSNVISIKNAHKLIDNIAKKMKK